MDFGPRRRIDYDIGVAPVFMFACSLEQLNTPIPSRVSELHGLFLNVSLNSVPPFSYLNAKIAMPNS
jgi:hypothetical protein